MGMAAILINGTWPFEQIFSPTLTEGSKWNLKKTDPAVSEEKSFKGAYGWTDGRTAGTTGQVITIAHTQPRSMKTVTKTKSCLKNLSDNCIKIWPWLFPYIRKCLFKGTGDIFSGGNFKGDLILHLFWKWVFSKRKEFAPNGSKFFPFRADPIFR